ncbi:hypothetical protein K501DRAFT_274951 [Backusella circina FSU 941]|nr:hypothetical protein K501DRAFT_274951 [Backusella circina FSU 941]
MTSFYRHLRAYTKPGASYLAGYKSDTFADHEYQGRHPLCFYQDESQSRSNLTTIAWKIICNYINRTVNRNEVQDYLRLLLKSRAMNRLSNEVRQRVTTAASLYDIIKENEIGIGNFASAVLYKIKMIEEVIGGSQNSVNITLYDLETANDKNTKLRDFVNCGLYDSVKRQS